MLLGLYLTGNNHDFIKTIIDNRNKKSNFGNENKGADSATYNIYVKDAIVDTENEDVNNSNCLNSWNLIK